MSAAGSMDDMSVTLTLTSSAGDCATAAEKTGAHAAADCAEGVVVVVVDESVVRGRNWEKEGAEEAGSETIDGSAAGP